MPMLFPGDLLETCRNQRQSPARCSENEQVTTRIAFPIPTGSAETANALNNTVPWMNSSTAIVTTGFLIIVGSVGLNGFTDSASQYVGAVPETPNIES